MAFWLFLHTHLLSMALFGSGWDNETKHNTKDGSERKNPRIFARRGFYVTCFETSLCHVHGALGEVSFGGANELRAPLTEVPLHAGPHPFHLLNPSEQAEGIFIYLHILKYDPALAWCVN